MDKTNSTKVTADGKDGGLLAGKAHSECDENGCGIKAVVVSDNGGTRDVELEDEEAIINKRTMKEPSILRVTGTPAQIASAINEYDGNGVKFASGAKIEVVKKVHKYGQGGKFSSTPESLAVLLDDLFKDHCAAFAFAQKIARTTDSNLDENKALLVSQWHSEIQHHFSEEENELFPLINDGTNDLLIDQLLKEHMYFESVINAIESGSTIGSADIREFARKLMLHIQTEDGLFMKYGENKYSSPMALVESGADSGSCVYCVKGTVEQIRSTVERYESANGVVEKQEAPEISDASVVLPDNETQPSSVGDTMATGGRLRHNTHNKDKKLFGGIIDANDPFLVKAKSMKENGFTKKQILSDTWWRYDDHDHKWKIEFDDSRAKLLISYPKIISNINNGKYLYTYKDLINYPELFNRYPEVRNFTIDFNNIGNKEEYAESGFANNNFNIVLYLNLTENGTDKGNDRRNESSDQRVIRLINHEVQHFLQFRHEFGGAISKDEAELRISRQIEELESGTVDEQKQAKELSKKDNFDTEAFALYRRYLGEIEARDVDSRINYNRFQRNTTAAYSSNTIPENRIKIIPAKLPDDYIPNTKFQSGGVPDAGDYHQKAKDILANLSESDLEALKQTYKDALDAVLLKEQVKLDELAVERERLLSNKKLQEASGAYNSTGSIIAEIGLVDVRVRGVNNTMLAIRNGGDTVSFTDKKGDSHSGIPDFSKVNTTFISFSVDTILVDALPVYVPLIDEKVFAGKGYLFDAIRIAKDYYILAVNGFGEFNTSYRLATSGQKTRREDWEQGYVMVTLDQLALISDYYYTKAKAVERKLADERNAEMEKRYAALPLVTRENYFSKTYYKVLPVAVKKKVTESEWNALSLSQKEELYKPIAYVHGKRLVSKLEDDRMWLSFHEMYERFMNPLAIPIRLQVNSHPFRFYFKPICVRVQTKGKSNW